jgi:Mrp family chromosome partitioning ATPase
VSDPLLIASKSDGVILLGRAGFTRRDRLEQAATALTQSGIRLVGVVLNQQTSQTSGYYYYYGDYGSSTGKMDQPVFTGGTSGHLSSTD